MSVPTSGGRGASLSSGLKRIPASVRTPGSVGA